MHNACTFPASRCTTRGDFVCSFIAPSIRIKVFIHLCVHKLVIFVALFLPLHSRLHGENWQNNWVNKFGASDTIQHESFLVMDSVCTKHAAAKESTSFWCDVFIHTETGANKKNFQRQKKAIDNHSQQQTKHQPWREDESRGYENVITK